MNAPTDAAVCPRCGSVLPDIRGLCPQCLARGAADWLVAPPAREELPAIPGWRIVGTLGAGGMGRVFQADSENDGRAAAIKVLDARWLNDPVIAARFESEAQMLRRLDHPNVVRLIECTETDDGRLCLVMELVHGCDLGRLLRAEKLPAARAIEVFEKVCGAVAHAHAQGFIHRDIKPSNILVDRDGTVKLADFGLAKDLAEAGGAVSAIGGLTATTDQFGTAYYLAPERMLPAAASGPQTDVYALGVLLYHLLAGQMPLGRFTALSQLTGLPKRFDAIVAGAIEANPARRTGSVAELQRAVAAAWREHLAGAGRTRQFRRAAAVVGALALTALVAFGSASWQRARMKTTPPVFPAPGAATAEQPWRNSLGMQFVPVPGTKVLFSIYETRQRDFQPFLEADRGGFSHWRSDQAELVRKADRSILTVNEAGDLSPTGTRDDPGFPITPDHPACGIGIRDAQFFCLWLTWREQFEGRLPAGWRYRLPTNAEWLTACGGGEAPLRAGNLAGPEARSAHWPAAWPTLPQADPFPRAAPVGSFPAELHGLHDLSGNVSEWVQDENEPTNFRPGESAALLRGPNFADRTAEMAAFTYHRRPWRHLRVVTHGFRVVLAGEALVATSAETGPNPAPASDLR